LRLPDPLDLPWELKPVQGAESGTEVLPDRRVRHWIRHEVLKGVTPAMLVWWFQHLEGEVEVDGRRVERYRVWHPRDHVYIRYAKRLADGSVGPGAKIELCEYLGRKYRTHIVTEIEKLDEEGFIHNPAVHGVRLARMEYTWREAPGGTLYENALILGRGSWLHQRVIAPLAFPQKRGDAWIRHNVEEVGSFEHFLPALYETR